MMSYREARDYLEQVRDMAYQVRRAEAELRMLEERRISIRAVGYDSYPVQSSSDGQGFTRLSDWYLDRKEETRGLQLQYTARYHEIQEEISSISNRNYRDLLSHRYLDNMSFSTISRCMCFTNGYIRHMHKDALEAFDREVLRARATPAV